MLTGRGRRRSQHAAGSQDRKRLGGRSNPTTALDAWRQLYRRTPLEIEAASIAGSKRSPYFGEVTAAIAQGSPNVFLFAGPSAWARAKRRREVHGPGTALVLPDDDNPLDLRWPALDALLVAWPDPNAYRRKLMLGQALARDGVRYACIEHAPRFLDVWIEGGRRG
jgi:hypothetical protein